MGHTRQSLLSALEERQFRDRNAGAIILETINVFTIAKEHDRADVWQRKWNVFVKSEGHGNEPSYAHVLAPWGPSLLERMKFAEAESVLRDCLAIRQTSEPDDWQTFITMTFPKNHKDPFDRLLVAQAIVEELPLLSADSAIDDYGIPRLW